MTPRPLLLALAFLLASSGSAQERQAPADRAPLDRSGYLAELDAWGAAADRLREHPEEAPKLRQALPRAWSVTLDGQPFEIPTRWLDFALESVQQKKPGAPAAREHIQRWLAAMRVEAVALAGSPGLPPGVARGKLDEILHRREFRGTREPTWLDRLRERVDGWMTLLAQALLRRFSRHPKAARGFLWAVVVGLVLASLVWLVRLLLYRSGTPRLDLRADTAAATTWQKLARDALAAASREDYRDAIRLAYWAGVYRLEELGVWQVDRTRTHREYLDLLPWNHPQHGALAAVTAVFERIWYGGQSATSDHFQATLAQLEKLGCLFPSNPATASS